LSGEDEVVVDGSGDLEGRVGVEVIEEVVGDFEDVASGVVEVFAVNDIHGGFGLHVDWRVDYDVNFIMRMDAKKIG
jgi:hypothetical protein